jgi:glycosyltransferase involved in cell wall biosynthesis
MISCSVVVPVHNEAGHLEEFVLQFWDSLGDAKANIAEIILMENGSTDSTFNICERLSERLPLVVPYHVQTASYGEAVRQGIFAAKGDAVCILECDVMDAGFLCESLNMIAEGHSDFVVASKRHPGSVDRRPLKRRILTLLFNLWLKYFFDFPGTDTHGLKTIRTDVAGSLCQKTVTGGEVFQTELMLLAYRLGYKVAELPITLSERRAPKVSVVRRLPKVLNIIRELRASLDRFPVRR